MNITKFALLIIGLTLISLITTAHCEKPREVHGKEIRNADKETNIDPNVKNHHQRQCYKVPEVIVSEPIDDDEDIITIEDDTADEPIDDEDSLFQHLEELARKARSTSSNFRMNLNRHQEENEELHRTLDMVFTDEIVVERKAEEKPNKEKNNRMPKIVGGESDHEKEIKYQVVLHNGSRSVCGATILSDRYLLSAAHCFIDKDDNPYAEQIYVLIGTNKLSRDHTNIVKVKTVYVPITFHATENMNELGDIAVLKLTKGLGLGKDPRIAKVDLPEPLHDNVYDTYVGKEGVIAGFGANYLQFAPSLEYAYEYKIKTVDFPKNLVKARVDVLEESECNRIWLPLPMTAARLCGRIKGQHEHRGVCMGDSGNALVHENMAIGVISIGYDLCTEEYQHNGKPTIYTRVSFFKEFIKNAMADKTNEMRIFDIMNMED